MSLEVISLIKNRFLWAYALIYATSFFVLSREEGYQIEEAAAMFVLFCFVFPLIAYLTTKAAIPLDETPVGSVREVTALVFLLVVITAYLAIGPTNVNEIAHVDRISSRLYDILVLAQKIAVFVVLPMLVFRLRFGYSLRDFGLRWSPGSWLEKRHLRTLAVMLPIMIVFQYFAGRAAAPIREGEFSAGQLGIGLPLAYVWLLLEVGLVEEFFFRAVLQSRLSAYLKSDVGGILLAALIFGVAHAPGLIMRGAGANSPVGADPSGIFAVAYSVVVLSATGIFLGVIWARTRNLWLLMMIHAAVDLLSNFSDFAKTWGI